VVSSGSCGQAANELKLKAQKIMNGGSTQEQVDQILLGNEDGSTRHPKSPPIFISALLTIAGGQLGCVAIAAIAEICFARLLGPAPRGLISLCLMAVAFGGMVGSLGSEATVVVWISRSRGHHHSAWFPAVMFWVATGCFLSASAWAVLYWRVHPSFLKGITPELALLVLWSIPVTVAFSVSMAMLVGEERFYLRSLIALVNRIAALLAFLIIVLLLGRRAETAIIGNLVGLLVALGIAAAALRPFFRNSWQILRAQAQLVPTVLFGISGQAGTLASFFSYRLDVFVVNYFLDASQVGLYSLGVIISEALWQLPAIVATALFPRTARTVDAGADNFTCMILRQVSLITIVAALLIALASPVAIPLIFGARFAPSIAVVWWILPGTVALSLGKVVAADLTARGLVNHLPVSAVIGLILTLILDFLLIPRLGIQGAALASSVAYLGSGVYLLAVIQRELKTSWKNLLIPSFAELKGYGRLWLLFRARFRSLSTESRTTGAS
jgi:O-antigen/teichoic acid export membrane protein